DGGEEIARFDRVTTGPAGVQQRQLEEELGRRRDAEPATGRGWQHTKMLLERLENLVRVQREVAQDLAEHVPLDLRKCETEVLIGQDPVFAAARFVQRAVHNAFSRLSQLVLWDVEVLHGALPVANPA